MDTALEHRLKRLVLFRVVMITTLLAIAVAVEMVSETLLRVNPLYLLIIATYLLTLVHIVLLRLLGARSALVYAQVAGDLLVITGLVYLTGGTGTRAGFMLLFPISVLSGSVAMQGRGLRLAGLATGCYAALLVAVRAGLVPPQGLADVQFLPAKHLFFSVFVLSMACVTVALIGSYLSQSLKSADKKLEEAEEQMADLQELNEVIVGSIQSGLLTTDAEGRVLYLNPYGESVLGKKGADIRGKGVRQVFGSPALDPLSLGARRPLGRGLVRLDVSYERPDGELLTLGLSASPLAAAGGGLLLVFQDLTEIRRLEQEVRLKEELAAVGEMAAYLAHEIRNPLGSISGSAQVLLSEPSGSQEHERLLDIIRRESKRLSKTLEQFLVQVRPLRDVLEPVDLGPVLSEAAMLLRNGPEVRANHVVDFHADGGPHLCLADRDRILQVFWNLARNGLEAMPDGGVLRIDLSRAGGQIVLSVRDEGRGIDHGEQRRIFEPFRTGTPGGTGLGLSIVYRIVKDHAGDIRRKSDPHHGTEVEVRLPLVSSEARARTPAATRGLSAT
jgi:two-component system, NtrC family, sensor histidine kinase PilS